VIWKVKHQNLISDLVEGTALLNDLKTFMITSGGWNIVQFATESRARCPQEPPVDASQERRADPAALDRHGRRVQRRQRDRAGHVRLSGARLGGI
jgi:hypothetical protein